MANNTDRQMSRMNERLMSCSQRMLDELGFILDDIESISEQNPERDDIRACVDELKTKSKKAATESWAVANHWSEHFDGLGDDTDNNVESDDVEDKPDEPIADEE